MRKLCACTRPAIAWVDPQIPGHAPSPGRLVCDRHLADTCLDYERELDCDPVVSFLPEAAA